MLRSFVLAVALPFSGCCSALLAIDTSRLDPSGSDAGDSGALDGTDAAADQNVGPDSADGNPGCACPAGRACCGTACVDLGEDPANCGACGHECSAVGSFCAGGRCECPSGLIDCAGACVDTRSDSTHCGGCGVTCSGGGACSSSRCTCPAGSTFCADTGCVDTQFDLANCGRCGNPCSTGRICAWGNCACDPRVYSFSIGECVNRDNDPRSCGWIGARCSDSTPVCDQGACRASCTTAGTTNCDGSCTDVEIDPRNCGRCGHTCPSATICGAGCCREVRVPAGCGNDLLACPRPSCVCPPGFFVECARSAGSAISLCIGPCT